MLYTFVFSGIAVKVPRSREKDTDYATLGIAVLDAQGTQVATFGPQTLSLGELGGGSFSEVNLAFENIEVPDGGSMLVAATAINMGSWSGAQPLETALNDVSGAVLGALAGGQIVGYLSAGAAAPIPVWVAILAAAGIAAVMEGVGLLLADCDGWVAGSPLKLGSSRLAEKTQDGTSSWSTDYPGENSHFGCGANSDYEGSYWLGRQDQVTTVPRIIGTGPAEARTAVERAGLVAEWSEPGRAAVIEAQAPLPGTLVPRGTDVGAEIRVPGIDR
jgi:hypothetical protein